MLLLLLLSATVLNPAFAAYSDAGRPRRYAAPEDSAWIWNDRSGSQVASPQDEFDLEQALLGLSSVDARTREQHWQSLALHLRVKDRDRILAHWASWSDADRAQWSPRWFLLFERRGDLAHWIYDAWLTEHREVARDWAMSATVRAIQGPASVREDLPPRIALFPPAIYTFEPELSLRRGVRDLVYLAQARVPIVVAPEAPPLAEEARSTAGAPYQEGSRGGLRPDQWLEQVAQVSQLEIFAYPRLMWVAPWTESGPPSAADIAASLVSALEGHSPLKRERAYEALAALGVAGWHDWCEGRALQQGLDRDLEVALFGAGSTGVEAELTSSSLALYLVSEDARAADRSLPALGVDRKRLRFRALLRRLPPHLSVPQFTEFITGLPPDAQGAELLHLVLAWRHPAAEVAFLQRLLQQGKADQAVFAWRSLLRAAQHPDAHLLRLAIERAPTEERLIALYMQELERAGLPLEPARAREQGVLWRSIPGLEDLALEAELRSSDPTAVEGALDAFLSRYQNDRRFGNALARLQESFARCDPERRVYEGPRAPLFAALSKIAKRDPAKRNAAAAWAHEMGWILVTDELLRSSGVDPLPAPRLRDADPYEGGIPTSSIK